ncbi:MAG: hypothetical protein QXY49_01795 [Thermofilaceae archaeon]
MSYDLLIFDGFGDLLKYLESEIVRLKGKIEELEARYEQLRLRAEKVKRLEDLLSKLVGEEIKTINEVDFKGIRVVVSARALDELTAVEEALSALRDQLSAIARVREVIVQLAKETDTSRGGLKLLVQTLNGIPIKLLFKESET